MASVREILEINISNGWTQILVDPDADGYIEMIVDKITVERDTMWSLVNTEDVAGFIPYGACFDYDIFIKMTDDSSFKTHKYAITRRL